MPCPKDGRPFCDDLCYGGGCLQMSGYSMLAQCTLCGGTIDEEIPDCGTCTCDEIDEYGDCYECGKHLLSCECGSPNTEADGSRTKAGFPCSALLDCEVKNAP